MDFSLSSGSPILPLQTFQVDGRDFAKVVDSAGVTGPRTCDRMVTAGWYPNRRLSSGERDHPMYRTSGFGCRKIPPKLLCSAIFFLVLTACSTTQPPQVRIALEQAPKVIALPRLVFSADRPDPFCDLDAVDRTYYWVRGQLEKKGYSVVPLPLPALENNFRPDPWAKASAAELLGKLPEGADALLLVRITHYLVLDFCPREEYPTFELAGEAELFAPGHQTAVWRSSGTAGTIVRSVAEDAVFSVGTDLAEQLVGPLPPAR